MLDQSYLLVATVQLARDSWRGHLVKAAKFAELAVFIGKRLHYGSRQLHRQKIQIPAKAFVVVADPIVKVVQ